MAIYKRGFEFIPLIEKDIPLLCEWLNRPHLQEWWRQEEVTLETVRKKYLPRVFEADTARPFLVYLERKPIGYIQFYRAFEGDLDWWPDKPGPGVLGIDQFLANENQLGKGIGTVMIAQFVKMLMKDNKNITEIRVDPRPDNQRAIRCYKKVGFREVGPIVTPDGPALMMVLKKRYLSEMQMLQILG